ncbi:MAG TPA: zf-HC2 domain-containing protein, partial [Gemmatimonadales bacterium]
MTHPSLEAQLDAYLDGELAAPDAREIEAHLARCPECAQLRAARLELRAAIAERVPALRAPPALRERVQEALRATAP